MDLKEISRDENAFLADAAVVELSGGRRITVPHWTARKALRIGARLAKAYADEKADAGASDNGKPGHGVFVNAILGIAGELVCETLNEPDTFLDTLTKEDLVNILLAVVKQEFLCTPWREAVKKAVALLPQAR